VGRVTYHLKDRQNWEMHRQLNLLADFAFYSGVGAKTAMGMGQVRRIEG
jgi:CRISPR-associated endoribonuclease Cas6